MEGEKTDVTAETTEEKREEGEKRESKEDKAIRKEKDFSPSLSHFFERRDKVD